MKPETIIAVVKIANIAGITDEAQLREIAAFLNKFEREAWTEGFNRSSEVNSKTMDVVLKSLQMLDVNDPTSTHNQVGR